jgi:hypothetical protein
MRAAAPSMSDETIAKALNVDVTTARELLHRG